MHDEGCALTLGPDFEILARLAGDVLDVKVGAVGVVGHRIQHMLLPLQLLAHLLFGMQDMSAGCGQCGTCVS